MAVIPSNRILFGAAILLSLAGAAVVGVRFSQELEQAQRLLSADLKARSVAVDQSVRTAQSMMTTVAKVISHNADPTDIYTLLHIAKQAAGASDIVSLNFITPKFYLKTEGDQARLDFSGHNFYVRRDGDTLPQEAWLFDALKSLPIPLNPDANWSEPRTDSNRVWKMIDFIAVPSYASDTYLAAELDLATLGKYTFPLFSSDSSVVLLDGSGKVLADDTQ